MGYYTRFSLEVDNIENNKDYDLGVLHAGGSDEDFVCEQTGYTWAFEDTTKWYDYDKDMKLVSKNYPGVLFTLSGEGEESGDIWKSYYWNGKSQFTRATLVFEEFNPEKLK